jgi:hypothetical protein
MRWGRNRDEPLLNVDTGAVLDTGKLHEEEEDTSYLPKQWEEWELDKSPNAPFFAWCEDKEEGVEGLRGRTREEHLEYLMKSGRVVAAGPIFEIKEEEEEEMGEPKGSLVVMNARSMEDAEEFVKNDPYNKAGLFENVMVRRINEADVSGKFGIANKYEPEYRDPVEYELEEEGGYDMEKTPWLI